MSARVYGLFPVNKNELEIFDAAKTKIEAAWAAQKPTSADQANELVFSFENMEILAEDGIIEPEEVEKRAFWLLDAGFRLA